MVMQVLIGSAIIAAAIFIHIGVTTTFELGLQREHLWPGKPGSLLRFSSLLLGMTLLLLTHLIQLRLEFALAGMVQGIELA